MTIYAVHIYIKKPTARETLKAFSYGTHKNRHTDCFVVLVCVLLRVEVWRRWSSHPVRWGLDICGAGQLETSQHPAALQGQSPTLPLQTVCYSVKSECGPWLYRADCVFLFFVRQVPDGATVALVPRHSKHIHHDNHDYVAGESEFLDYNNSEVVCIHGDQTTKPPNKSEWTTYFSGCIRLAHCPSFWWTGL